LLVERTALARVVTAGLAAFWGARLVVQLFVYRAELWRGNRFRTVIHVAFTGVWAYLAVVYGAAFVAAG
jgi:hypothetical protein